MIKIYNYFRIFSFVIMIFTCIIMMRTLLCFYLLLTLIPVSGSQTCKLRTNRYVYIYEQWVFWGWGMGYYFKCNYNCKTCRQIAELHWHSKYLQQVFFSWFFTFFDWFIDWQLTRFTPLSTCNIMFYFEFQVVNVKLQNKCIILIISETSL